MLIYLTQDPQTERIGAQGMPFARDRDFPPGLTGDDWECRLLEVPDWTWDVLLSGGMPPAEQDRLHREWWSDANPTPESQETAPLDEGE